MSYKHKQHYFKRDFFLKQQSIKKEKCAFTYNKVKKIIEAFILEIL